MIVCTTHILFLVYVYQSHLLSATHPPPFFGGGHPPVLAPIE